MNLSDSMILEASAADAVGRPRRRHFYPLNKTIFIFIDSQCGSRASGVFMFDLLIVEDKEDPHSLKVVVSSGINRHRLFLQPINTFYDQKGTKHIGSATTCQSQYAPEQVYLFPRDVRVADRKSAPPYLFNLKKNEIPKELPLSHGKKWFPAAAAVGKLIYVLPTGDKNVKYSPFEAYDPVINKWIRLPPTHNTLIKKDPSGYAVLKDKFILFCVISSDYSRTESDFYSFNTESHKWKPVKQQPRLDTDTSNAQVIPALFGQGVVLFEGDDYADCRGGVIYCYDSSTTELLEFSYIDETTKFGDSDGDYDLSLGPVSLVKGFELKWESSGDDDWGFIDTSNYESGTIAKLHDNILCLLHSDPKYPWDVMEVNGMIIRIDDDDVASCSILKIFTCDLSLGDLLLEPQISACIVLPGESMGELAKQRRKLIWQKLGRASKDVAELEVKW